MNANVSRTRSVQCIDRRIDRQTGSLLLNSQFKLQGPKSVPYNHSKKIWFALGTPQKSIWECHQHESPCMETVASALSCIQMWNTSWCQQRNQQDKACRPEISKYEAITGRATLCTYYQRKATVCRSRIPSCSTVLADKALLCQQIKISHMLNKTTFHYDLHMYQKIMLCKFSGTYRRHKPHSNNHVRSKTQKSTQLKCLGCDCFKDTF